MTTGSGGRVGTKPFTRYAGPDMTGLFLGDTGAFGLKLAATLRLEPAPQHLDYLGFGFDDMRAMALAQVEMSAVRGDLRGLRHRSRQGAELGQRQQAERRRQDPRQRRRARRKGLLQGIKDAVGVATTGAGYLADHACSLHLVVEGSSADALAASMAALRAIGAKHGIEIENAAARVMRSRPFNPVRGMLGADGQRWVPIHAVFPLSEAERAVAANAAYFKSQAAR